MARCVVRLAGSRASCKIRIENGLRHQHHPGSDTDPVDDKAEVMAVTCRVAADLATKTTSSGEFVVP